MSSSSPELVVRFEPNTKTVIDYDLSIIDPAGATGAYLVTGDTLSFNVVQYIRFVVDKAQPDGALAEIEVWTPGENIALGTLNRGGNIVSGTDTEGVVSVMDGDMNEWWSVTAERDAAGDWELSGAWYEWDLGATFWLDRHVALSFREGFGTSGGGNNRQHGFIMFTSDGEELTGFSGDRVESNFDYEELTEVDNILVSPPRYIYDFHFPMRPVRYVFYHVVNKFHANGHPHNHFIRLWEHLWFGGGYPAARGDDIRLYRPRGDQEHHQHRVGSGRTAGSINRAALPDGGYLHHRKQVLQQGRGGNSRCAVEQAAQIAEAARRGDQASLVPTGAPGVAPICGQVNRSSRRVRANSCSCRFGCSATRPTPQRSFGLSPSTLMIPFCAAA